MNRSLREIVCKAVRTAAFPLLAALLWTAAYQPYAAAAGGDSKDTGKKPTDTKVEEEAPPAPKIEGLFDDAGLPLWEYNAELKQYDFANFCPTESGDNVYLVSFAMREIELVMGEPDYNIAYFFSNVYRHPKSCPISSALLKKVALINDGIPIGTISLSGENDFYYNVSVWMRTLDADSLAMTMAVSCMIMNEAEAQLQAFAEECK